MRFTTLEGNQLYYNIYGSESGPVVVLLHGFAETSQMWIPILPYLNKFCVITIDLPGIGYSSISNKMNIILAANQIHSLISSLGITSARIVGHDIGLMVAYAYTVLFPLEVNKLVLMDAFLPGIKGWDTIYNDPNNWHFRFIGSTPEALIDKREDIYFSYFWDKLAADANHSIPETYRKLYLENYSRPGRMNAAWKYFESFPQTAIDMEKMSKIKLSMPVLSIGGDKSLGNALSQQVKLIAHNVNITNVIVKNSGHWVLEEQPTQTINAILEFL